LAAALESLAAASGHGLCHPLPEQQPDGRTAREGVVNLICREGDNGNSRQLLAGIWAQSFCRNRRRGGKLRDIIAKSVNVTLPSWGLR
jgi:hypothetical protein